MKNLFALILAASVLIAAGCAQEQKATDQEIKNGSPMAMEEVPGTELPASVGEEKAEGKSNVNEKKTDAEPPMSLVEEEPTVGPAADKIYFDLNSSELTSASREALEGNAHWLQTQPGVRIIIEGHTDHRGSEKYNLALGKSRAKTARDYLVTLGVSPERMTITSYGKEKATGGAASEAIWARDRRAEFIPVN
jgi:peptidoglycan-associated lipoprotein